MELQTFNFEGTDVRTVTIEGDPYFVGKDVANILGYKNGSRDINNHVDEEDKLKYQISTAGQIREQTVINESGLYSLILGSKLPSAKKFKRWVTSEVLPMIRKHGAYMTDEKAYDIVNNGSKGLADLLQQAADQLKQKDIQIAEMKPKALFADAVSTSETPILVGELAKMLKQNGVEMGQRRLFAWMRENGYLIKRKGTDYNMPTQRAMELGLFRIKESTHVNGDGVVVISKTPKVTGKGQVYFVNKFMEG
ncbi:phage antirepressor [Limosilactobacillus equigenerosi]|uniref:Antirepressor n=1 Tax=Limosilactobacillus equigenerosi DSM 18793 = JCM 14505 TaxID=1423742 RepID=A0A0R1UPV4_9LACO|nr:phage antirepressor [Limosilactobacillus equigenerosi]KRL95196.1 antirepressor [Limosilactobacillus equigenerosi DSM 18793 = JCM 14505]